MLFFFWVKKLQYLLAGLKKFDFSLKMDILFFSKCYFFFLNLNRDPSDLVLEFAQIGEKTSQTFDGFHVVFIETNWTLPGTRIHSIFTRFSPSFGPLFESFTFKSFSSVFLYFSIDFGRFGFTS
jgi:hypothetical protein